MAKRLFKNLTFQVLIAILVGIFYGMAFPESAQDMKPLGDAFIKMVKMVIAPIVFLTVVCGMSSIGDVKKVGKMGVRAIIYFEIVTTIAIILGMLAMNILKPGAGMDTSMADGVDLSKYLSKVQQQKEHTTVDFLMGVIPDSAVGAFATGDLLQVLFISVFFGLALAAAGEKGKPVEEFLERITTVFFGIITMIMKFAPLAAFGAIAFTIGKFGIESLIPLGKLILFAVMTMGVFIAVVLGAIGVYYRVNVFKFIRYIKDEIIIVVGTGSSETVLPRLMEKLQALGCSRSVVGLVIPTGYSFNLDGTSLYLAMCTLFIAQAYGVDLSIGQQVSILGIMLLTSKGAAGVAGSGFIVLAATVAASKVLPVEGLALLLGIDRFMSSVRATVNLIGNGFATMIISRMQGELNDAQTEAEYKRAFGED